MLEVKCLSSFESLKAIAEQWEQLLRQSLHNSYSLSWSWISHWIEVFLNSDDQLLCLVVYDNKHIVGIGPFWVETKRLGLFGKVKILQFFGSREVCSDHLDLIIHRKNSENICTAIWEQLFGSLRKCWDVWEYNSVAVDSKILQYLRKKADHDNRCIGFKINDYSVCPYLDLPETWEKYLALLSANQRRALKVSTNNMSNAGDARITFCETEQELPSFMETQIKLHRKSWQERGKNGSYRTERFRRFHLEYSKEQLKRGNLFLCNLVLNNIPAGSFYGFVYNKTLQYYLIGVNRSAVTKASIGRVLLARCIEEAIKRGYKKFDFLRGFEHYKYDWTNLEQRELVISFYNRTLKALFFVFWQFITIFCKQTGYVFFKNMLPFIKRLHKKDGKIDLF